MALATYEILPEIDTDARDQQLAWARLKADDLRRAFEYMINQEARRAERQAGKYLVSFNVEAAQGPHPPMGSTHIEVSVRDAADGRFVPGLTVYATLIDPTGHEIGTHQQPYLGHHWLYPYGRNWLVPGSGDYRLRVRIESAESQRHCGLSRPRCDGIEVEFAGVAIEPCRSPS